MEYSRLSKLRFEFVTVLVVFLWQTQFIMSSFVNVSVDYEKLSFHTCANCLEPDLIVMQFMEQSIRS